MEFLSETIGNTREKTNQGYLVLRDVPIARTGVMLYAPGEVPLSAGKDGLVRIARDPSVVFAPETIASFQGVPITLEHPSEDVDPVNWKQHSVGIVLDVRQGVNIADELLIADLLITDKEAIEGIESGRYREVSAGYDADYIEDEPGQGRQTSITGNHLALLSGAGRCGPVCRVGDSANVLTNSMTKFFDAIRNAFKTRDEKALEDVLNKATIDADKEEEKEEKKSEETKDDDPTLSDLLARIEALEAAMKGKSEDEDKSEEEKKEDKSTADDDEDEDDDEPVTDKKRKRKSKDEAADLQSEVNDVFARAEILSPGIKLPTFDAKADSKSTRDSLCALRRKALRNAYANDKTRDFIEPFVGSEPDFKTLDCAKMQAAFVGASELIKRSNNATLRTSRDSMSPQARITNQIAEMNRANAEFWARNK